MWIIYWTNAYGNHRFIGAALFEATAERYCKQTQCKYIFWPFS